MVVIYSKYEVFATGKRNHVYMIYLRYTYWKLNILPDDEKTRLIMAIPKQKDLASVHIKKMRP